MDLLEKARGFLKTDDDRSERTQEADERDARTAAPLSRCSPCGTTYVKLNVETCPECGDPLQSTPNESDLGMS